MKYPLLPLCVMLSLLTGCSASARPLSTQLPTLEPDASPSSSPASTEYISPSASWWTHLDLNDLPSQKVDVTGQLPQEELFLLDELPEDDVSLYGYLSAGDTPSGILLRHGATYTHFDVRIIGHRLLNIIRYEHNSFLRPFTTPSPFGRQQ